MTLRFSSFSIKDILTGQPGAGRTEEELCPPESPGVPRVPDLTPLGVDESCIPPERPPADLSVSEGNPPPETCSQEPAAARAGGTHVCGWFQSFGSRYSLQVLKIKGPFLKKKTHRIQFAYIFSTLRQEEKHGVISTY